MHAVNDGPTAYSVTGYSERYPSTFIPDVLSMTRLPVEKPLSHSHARLRRHINRTFPQESHQLVLDLTVLSHEVATARRPQPLEKTF